MFELENILNYASANIQIIGIFIAIIGGIVATKLINAKIEKDTLTEKLNILNKEIDFNNEKKLIIEDKQYQIRKSDFIYTVYEKVIEKDFTIDDYDDFGLTRDQRLNIVEEIKKMICDGLEIFKVEHTKGQVESILKENHIQENTIQYDIYSFVGYSTGKNSKSNGLFSIPSLDDIRLGSHLTTLQENLEEHEINNRIEETNDIIKWKQIEKQDIESKLNALNKNLKVKNDVILFIFITIFSIVIPQIILSIYPLFYNYKFLKYVFAIYSIVSFIISMLLLLWYIYKLFINISNEEVKK